MKGPFVDIFIWVFVVMTFAIVEHFFGETGRWVIGAIAFSYLAGMIMLETNKEAKAKRKARWGNSNAFYVLYKSYLTNDKPNEDE